MACPAAGVAAQTINDTFLNGSSARSQQEQHQQPHSNTDNGTRPHAPAPLRICSLLPSATEVVGRLGLARRLVCVTHECDLAPDAATLKQLVRTGAVRRVTSSAIDPEILSQGEIDTRVRASLSGGACSVGGGGGSGAQAHAASEAQASAEQAQEGSLYSIDNAQFLAARPNVVLTQGLCDVCAPSTAQVTAACQNLQQSLQQANGTKAGAGTSSSAAPGQQQWQGSPDSSHVQDEESIRVASLEPQNLRDIADSFVTVAEACAVRRRGEAMRSRFVADMQALSAAVSPTDDDLSNAEASDAATAGQQRSNGAQQRLSTNSVADGAVTCDGAAKADAAPSVFVLEWLDPPFDAGHWVPEILQVCCGQVQGFLSVFSVHESVQSTRVVMCCLSEADGPSCGPDASEAMPSPSFQLQARHHVPATH